MKFDGTVLSDQFFYIASSACIKVCYCYFIFIITSHYRSEMNWCDLTAAWYCDIFNLLSSFGVFVMYGKGLGMSRDLRSQGEI